MQSLIHKKEKIVQSLIYKKKRIVQSLDIKLLAKFSVQQEAMNVFPKAVSRSYGQEHKGRMIPD